MGHREGSSHPNRLECLHQVGGSTRLDDGIGSLNVDSPQGAQAATVGDHVPQMRSHQGTPPTGSCREELCAMYSVSDGKQSRTGYVLGLEPIDSSASTVCGIQAAPVPDKSCAWPALEMDPGSSATSKTFPQGTGSRVEYGQGNRGPDLHQAICPHPQAMPRINSS